MSRVFPYFIAGIILGLKSGIVVGLLVAPHKGSLTRMRIKNRLKETRGLSHEALESFNIGKSG